MNYVKAKFEQNLCISKNVYTIYSKTNMYLSITTEMNVCFM